MKKLLIFMAAFAAAALFGADAAKDLIISQVKDSGSGNIQRNVAAANNGFLGFDSSGHPISISSWTISSGILASTTGSIAIGSDPADAGVIRLGNAAVIGWEASPAGTDVTLTVNSAEQFVMSSGLTITGALAGATTGAFSGQITSTVSTGTAPFIVASTTLVANLHAATADSSTASSTVTVVDDTTTNATMYPLWVTTTTGNLPPKVSSTKMSFNPSTGLLTTTAASTGALNATSFTNTNTRPANVLSYNATTAKSRHIMAATSETELTFNASFDGTNWNRDDTSVGLGVLVVAAQQLFFYGAASGANPATITPAIMSVTSTGINNTAIGITSQAASAFTTSLATTSYTAPIFSSNNADPADSGVIRLGNAELIAWEASPASTDVTLTVNSSEQFVFSNAILSPDIATSITTATTSFTAWAGATTLLTIGGTGASASLFAPSTLDSSSSTTGAIRTSGGISAAKQAWVGTTLTVVGNAAVGGATVSSSTGLITPVGTTALSSLRVPHGAAPTSPVNGDMWSTTTALFVRINGSTVQLGAASVPGSDTQVIFNDSSAFGADAGMTYNKTTDVLTLAGGVTVAGTPTGIITITGSTSGSLKITTADATAQIITISGAAQTSGATTLTIPDMAGVSQTFSFIGKAETLAGAKTFSGGVLASGANANDFSGGSGTFKTSTGANTISGAATFNSTVNLGGTALSFGALPSGATTAGALGTVAANTYTVTGTNTATAFQAVYNGAPTFTDASAGTVTDLFSENWAGPAVVAGSLAGTRRHTMGILDSTSAASSITGAFIVAATYGTTATSVGIGGGNINAGGNGTFGGTLSVTGHTTFEGVTSTGATGTGALVYSISPAFTTSPTAPTQTAGDNSTKIATTNYADRDSQLNFNAQSGTTYTLVLADGTPGSATGGVSMTNAAAMTLTVPTNASVAFPIGWTIPVLNLGAGSMTIAAAGGVTINAPNLTLGVNASGVLNKTATNTWQFYGQGLPAIVASGRSTAQTAAVGTVTSFTVGASDASFVVSANVLVTTATTHAFTVTCAYTDEGNTARTLTMTFGLVAGGVTTTSIANANGAVPYMGVPLAIRAKAATSITIATTGTFTTVTYNVEGAINQIR